MQQLRRWCGWLLHAAYSLTNCHTTTTFTLVSIFFHLSSKRISKCSYCCFQIGGRFFFFPPKLLTIFVFVIVVIRGNWFIRIFFLQRIFYKYYSWTFSRYLQILVIISFGFFTRFFYNEIKLNAANIQQFFNDASSIFLFLKIF